MEQTSRSPSNYTIFPMEPGGRNVQHAPQHGNRIDAQPRYLADGTGGIPQVHTLDEVYSASRAFQEVPVTPGKICNVSLAVACTALLAWSGGSLADEYHAGQFFKLDLPSAVLSPRPLGPASEFAPPSVAAVGQASEGANASTKANNQASNEVNAEPKAEQPKSEQPKSEQSKSEPKIVMHRVVRMAHLRAEKPRAAVRTKIARRHTNPLDAQAFDPRIQVWPCRTGGICDWKR